MNCHGADPDVELNSYPLKFLPQVSPTEQVIVHPDGNVFCVKNVDISNLFPYPWLTYAWLLNGVVIAFGVNTAEQSSGFAKTEMVFVM